MSGNTWTWNGTTDTTWEDTSANGWNASGENGGAASPDFNSGTDSFSIGVSGSFTISGISAGASDDVVSDLTVNDAGVTLVVDGTAGNFVINDVLNLTAGVLNLGTAGILELNSDGNTTNAFNLGASGVLTDSTGGGDSVFVAPDSNTNLTGSGTVIANAGMMDFGTSFTVAAGDTTNFQIANGGNLEFDDSVLGGSVNFLTNSGGVLVLTGTQVGNGTDLSGGTFGASIGGMGAGGSPGTADDIDITSTVIGGGSIASAVLSGSNNDILTVTDSSSDTFTFNLVGNYTTDVATFLTDGSGGFDIFLICYAGGTAILTGAGERAVETIQRGDTVMTLEGGRQVPRTVIWTGHRDIDLTRHPKPESVAPIRVRAGALSENLPHRDLLVSPDHCLFIDGALIPAKLLVNDMTISRDMSMLRVSYHHIELQQHAVLIAEGVAAESYLDTGNRAFFSNAGLAMILHPEMTINESLRCWDEDACAPLTVAPEAVRPVWQRFADRAQALGHIAPVHTTTTDAGIHLTVNGKIVRPLSANGKTISFMVPAGARSVRLKSRAARPSALTPWLDDPRTLGVAVRSVTLRDPSGDLVVNADHPGLRDGWHAAEHLADGSFWRWSTGDASLPFVTETACIVEIALSETTTYIENAQRLAA